MALLELCLLTLLSPQDPAATAVAPATPPAVQEAPLTQDPAEVLATALKAGETFDLEAVATVTNGTDAALAAQAAKLLTRCKAGVATPFLQQVVTTSPHADARTIAMQSLHQHAEVGVTATAIKALEDKDRRVRTLAAQTLGKLRRPTAVEPLLALLDASRDAEPGPATDVQAALLALHDLAAADKMLRAATAVHDGKAQGSGETLAYCLQQLSRQLPNADEQLLLLAVLDHREPLVRRFAIGRLAERGDNAATAALEARLVKEDAKLRPLVEVALAQLRKDHLKPPADELERAANNATVLLAKAKTFWVSLTAAQQGIAAGSTMLCVVVAWLWLRRRRRLDAAAQAAALAAMVAPSQEYADQVAAEAAELVAAAEEIAAEQPLAEGADDVGAADGEVEGEAEWQEEVSGRR